MKNSRIPALARSVIAAARDLSEVLGYQKGQRRVTPAPCTVSTTTRGRKPANGSVKTGPPSSARTNSQSRSLQRRTSTV
jgi:hypothetical protein